MKIKLLKDYRTLKKDSEVTIEPGKVNFWVGSNGSGKTSMLELIYSQLINLNPALKNESYWMFQDYERGVVEISGWEEINKILFCTTKLITSRMVQMEYTDQGLGALRASTGQQSIMDMMNAFQARQESGTIIFFDETDGHLDTKNKIVFFDHLLPQIKTTSVVISHDPLFLQEEKVYDFDTQEYTTGAARFERIQKEIWALKNSEKKS